MKKFLKVTMLVLFANATTYNFGMDDKAHSDGSQGIELAGPIITLSRLATQFNEQNQSVTESAKLEYELEQLPLELTTHLTIALEDITEEKLNDYELKYPNVISLIITEPGVGFLSAFMQEYISLLSRKFPNLKEIRFNDREAWLNDIEPLFEAFKNLKLIKDIRYEFSLVPLAEIEDIYTEFGPIHCEFEAYAN